MENKRRVLIFSTLLLSIFFIALFLANAANTIQPTGTNVNTTGDSGAGKSIGAITPLDGWTLGGVIETFNFTINNTGPLNITTVNITAGSGYALTSVLLWNVGANGTSYNWSAVNFSARGVRFNLTGDNNNMSLNNSANFSVQFAAINGTEAIYEWNVTTYDTIRNSSSVTLVTGIDGLAPRMATVNLTYGVNTRKDSDGTPFSTTTYIRNDTGFNITLTVTDYNPWEVLLIYNSSGGDLNLSFIGNGSKFAHNASLNGSLSNGDGPLTAGATGGANGMFIRMLNQTALNRSGLSASAPSYTYTAFISSGNSTNSGTAFQFVFVAYDLYNQSTQLNNSNAAFKVVEDGTSPTVDVTAPSTTTVSTSSSTGLTYVCSGSDANGTVSSYEWTLTKPGGDKVTKTTASATFATTDIDKAGTYQAKCKVTDGVGFTGESSTYEFSGHVTSTASSGASGGGGGSGSATTEKTTTLKVDNDLSVKEEVTLSKQQGRITTFTLDGQNSHKMTFKEVTASRVTLIIESTPIEVSLSIGETKVIDVDGDGVNDLEITLVNIKNGVADVKTKKIAETTLETTTTSSTLPKPSTTLAVQPAAKKSSLAWLWVLVILAIIIVIVVVMRKKKRR
ncbi:MAG TPA: hypothetical protein VJJ21_03790 [Candidatus Nanoarchaeia archaeon]|nr:hypothetical protein [Candidatus Nanoarchaeia archaeon]